MSDEQALRDRIPGFPRVESAYYPQDRPFERVVVREFPQSPPPRFRWGRVFWYAACAFVGGLIGWLSGGSQ